MILERLKALSKYGEIISGSRTEIKIRDEIKKFLEDVCDEIRITPIRTLNWEQRELIFECNGKRFNAISLPYSLSIDIEAQVVGEFDECKNNVIKIKVNDLYEINKYYIRSVDSGCFGVIFTLDDKMRKFIIKYGDLLSYKPNPPPPIPAIYVKASDFPYITGKCRILLKTSINPYATGYIIEGIVNSRNENKAIHITAHHDHWFYGERDDLLAVALLPEFASNLYEIHLISFTAEESGAINFSTFSWSYGSRTFLQKIINLDNIILNINLDNIGENNIVIKTVPSMVTNIRKFYDNVISIPEIYTDSYSYVKKGIPSINIESAPNPHYHSESDIIEAKDDRIINNIKITINLINRIINNNIEFNVKEMEEYLKNIMYNLPLSLKTYLINITDKLNQNDIYILRELFKFYGGIISLDKPYANVKLFHKIIGIEEARSASSKICIEDLGCLEKVKDYEEYNRYYSYYISELKEQITNDYLDKLYLLLKKFL
ncbi:M28 family peptidase [Saccharolobus caldissimus]|uniref:Zn-dependent exopeptidase M28 n=1 Tax=Saccharolobus caldissimus TaxID=1702097 RepID=A0AAQ4CPD2_9CREN|nr:M28 family peptidase [Saccharolobus caldissimus]BDB97663.1 Zn-dependent exopeptidase M28 [Saccharolobus caldissimus]